MSELKKALFNKFGGFADKRIKNLDKGTTFIADDRGRGDYGADRNLFLWFCSIFIDVKSESYVLVRLSGGVPWSSAIAQWAKSNNLEHRERPQTYIHIPISKGEEHKLNELASLLDAIVAPGERYEVAAYKYVCPRTAKSLRRLAKTLTSVWGT